MTEKAISPLRQRMVDDMTIRKLSPKTPSWLHSRRQGLCGVPRSFARSGALRSSVAGTRTTLST